MPGFFETMLSGVAAGVGFALGVGATAAGAERLRPLAKQAVKEYLATIDRVRGMTAELGETLEDLYAEAKAERDAEMRGAGGPQQGGAPQP